MIITALFKVRESTKKRHSQRPIKEGEGYEGQTPTPPRNETRNTNFLGVPDRPVTPDGGLINWRTLFFAKVRKTFTLKIRNALVLLARY